MKRLTHSLVIGLLLAVLSISASAEPKWQETLYIQKAFNEIALKNEYRTTQQKILKWLKPIEYEFIYHGQAHNPTIEKLFQVQMQHLSDITHHPIALSQYGRKPNYHIHITSAKDYPKLVNQYRENKDPNFAQTTNCNGVYRMTKKGEIIKGDIILPIDNLYYRGKLVGCVIEESMQLMGLPNDSDWVYPSVANDLTRVEYMSGLDVVMLQILYHPQIKIGMSLFQSQPIVYNIIEQMKSKDGINNAERMALQQGLFPFINH